MLIQITWIIEGKSIEQLDPKKFAVYPFCRNEM